MICRRPIHQSADCAAARSIVRDRITECLETHDFCKSRTINRPGFAPDQLIQIEAPDHIHLSTNHPATVDYIALSYCWGEQEIFSTTNESLSSHLADIPWAMVPKTFRQAIGFTHMLGYAYIWIDIQ
ncbi:hypothetical protein F5Y03DRAFT_261124 [Xylaria venustula]|nr:hypothetical protein F5Y03DRAFT_261124 [Xylaria venustula]